MHCIIRAAGGIAAGGVIFKAACLDASVNNRSGAAVSVHSVFDLRIVGCTSWLLAREQMS